MSFDPRIRESRACRSGTRRGAEEIFQFRNRSYEAMMPTRIPDVSFAAVVAFLLLASLLPGDSRADDFDLLIDKALDLSGLTAQLEALPAAILNAVPDEAFPTGKKRSDSKERGRNLIDERSVEVIVHQAVRRHCSAEVVAKIVGFYGSNFGKKVARIQKTALSDSTLQGIREGWKIVASLEPDRLALIERLVMLNRVGRRNARLLEAAIQGLAEGVAPSEPPHVTAKKVEEVGEAIRSMESTGQNTALVAYAHTFRSLRDGELKELVSFQESEAADRFGEAVHEGMTEAVKQIARAVGDNRQRPDSRER